SDTTVVAQFKVKNLSKNLSKKWSSGNSINLENESCGGVNHWAEFDQENQAARAENQESTYILAWTTTPWTLPSNTALAVGRDIEYVLVKTFNQYTFEPVKII